MKKFHIKHIIGGLLFLSSVALLSACSGTDDFIDTTAEVSGLKVGLTIGSSTVVSSKAEGTTASDVSLKEDAIANLNVFFFDAEGKLVKQYYKTSNVGNKVSTLLASSSSWTSTFTAGTTYQVYALANYGSDLSNITTLSDLKNLNPLDDANIYKPFSSSNDKLFVMDGNTTWTVPTTITDDVTIPVDVKRAASKIVLNVTFPDGDFKTNLSLAGDWTWNLMNYGSKASVITPDSPLSDMGVLSTSNGGTITQPTGLDATTQLITYSYQNVWNANDVNKQTMLEVNIPCKYNGVEYSTNKYYIPVTSITQTDRNFIYTVNAKIDHLGNTNKQEEITKLTYSVVPWLSDNIDINNSGASFLIVSPTTVILKNETDYNNIHFYSSDDVDVSVADCYYYNSSHSKSTVSFRGSVNIHGSNLKNGTLDFSSPVPTNFGPRYIVLNVEQKSGSKLSQTVKIIQYPLEYITSVQGSYSFKSVNDKYVKGETPWLDYCNGIEHDYKKGSIDSRSSWSSNMFTSRFFIPSEKGNYDKGIIYYINKKSRNTWEGDADDLEQYNNHMYAVRITSTSSDYIIDKPAIDSDGLTVGTLENDNVVSPAFMIASQLGVVSHESWSAAAEHCKKYVEVGVDGTIYDDWRLPTRSELQIICKFQNNAPQVMDEVLKGEAYWGAYHYSTTEYDWFGHSYTSVYGGVVYTSKPYNKGVLQDGSTYIRCIRDMNLSDLAKDNE